jgi:hypothetical protein
MVTVLPHADSVAKATVVHRAVMGIAVRHSAQQVKVAVVPHAVTEIIAHRSNHLAQVGRASQAHSAVTTSAVMDVHNAHRVVMETQVARNGMMI